MNPQFRKHLLAMSVATALPCYAQTSLPSVIITGSNPDVMQVDVSKKGFPSDTAKLLQSVAGVSMVSGGGVSGLPSIRGLADDRLRIQVDGMDLVSACANHMNPALSYIAPSQVESIQVLPGITPVSVGGDSIGGTIRVRSADPKFAEAGQLLREGQASFVYRGNGNVRDVGLAATLASETFSATYRGAAIKAGNYEDGGGKEIGSSAYESRNHALTLAMRAETRLLELKLGLQRMPYQGFPNQRMDLTRNDSEQFNLRYLERFGWGMLESRAYYEHTRHAMNFGADKQFWYGAKKDIPGMPMDAEGKNTGLSVKATIPLSQPDTLRVGADYRRYRLDDWWDPSGGGMAPDTFWNIRGGQRDRLGAYAEWDRRWNPAWFTQLGMRGEKVSSNTGAVQGYNAGYIKDASRFNALNRERDDHNLDLTAQARYIPSQDMTVKFGYARKARSPNLCERYTWSTGGMAMAMVNIAGDGNGYVGDPSLRPEVAHMATGSVEWHDSAQEKWSFAVSPFYTRVEDYIDARCLATCQRGAFVNLRFANVDARLYGAEVSAHAALASGSYGALSGDMQVNYVRGENRSTGDNLYNMMPLNTRLLLNHRLGAWSGALEVQAVSAKERVSTLHNELRTGGYALAALRTSYAWNKVQFDFGVENLFDRRYELPLGGAYVGQGMTMALNGVPYGIGVRGMGRSVYAGLTFKL
ncbi:TonB-dependent receptor [Pseudoduganella violaceinigra]|uniref:TonB-dependent receptor n=1 Tax=Pseudoduganella violaceinigra TaxID=246602 RepID=UPI0004169F66|nr:TonB-dependent receptor [Pseudoduganella violaceinigra]